MADYSPNVWSTGDLITAALLNHAEGQYANAEAEFSNGNWVCGGRLRAAVSALQVTYNPAGATYQEYRDPAGDLLMWGIGITGTKSGANAGGDLVYYAYNDAGAYLGNWLELRRSDGQLSLLGPLVMAGSVVLTAARVLQNVTANASIITAGNLALARMATGTGFLKASGSTPTYQSIATGDLPARLTSLFMHAGGLKPRTSNGCAALAWTELATNKIMVPTLDFDPTNNEYAQGMVAIPDGYNGGTITFRVHWTFASGSGNVIWGLQARIFGDGEALDQAFGTAVEVTDTALTANQEHISPNSGAVTIAGTPAGGKLVIFQVYRNAASASDTMTAADARLLGVTVEFTTAYTD